MTLTPQSEQTEFSSVVSVAAQELDMMTVLILLAKRRRFVFWFTLGFTALTTILVFVLPSRYKAETMVLPPGQNSSSGSAMLAQLGGSGTLATLAGSSLGLKSPVDMYVALLKSHTVEDALINRFGLRARYHEKKLTDARGALERRSSIVAGAKDGLIRIDVSDRDPKTAADIANAYVEEFRRLSANLAITEASQRRAFFQNQLLEAKQNLTNAESRMIVTERKTGVFSLDSQARSMIESAAMLQGQVSAKEVELRAISEYATEDNPQVMLAKQELAELKQQLAKLTAGSSDPNSEIIIPKGNIPQVGMEYLNSLRDVRYYETVAELISKEFEVAKLDEAREGAIIQVVDPARPPDKRSFPKRVITIVFGVILGFLAACGWVIADERLRQFRSNPEEAARLKELRSAWSGRH